MDRHVRSTHGKGEDRITVEDWLDELARESKPDVVPPGWYSMNQIALRTGLSLKSVDTSVSRGVRCGHYECRVFRTICAAGRLRPIKYYRKVGK